MPAFLVEKDLPEILAEIGKISQANPIWIGRALPYPLPAH
jgi:hypothetical protein